MKPKYSIKLKYRGKVISDRNGPHVLNDKISQRELKQLYPAHKDKIELIGLQEHDIKVHDKEKANTGKTTKRKDKGKHSDSGKS